MNSDSKAALEGLFRSFDVDNTGYLNKEQLRKFCSGISLTEEEFETIFTELDADRDDRISMDDFVRGFSDSGELLPESNTSNQASQSNQYPNRERSRKFSELWESSVFSSLEIHDHIKDKTDKKDHHREPSISWPDFIEEMGKDFYILPVESQEKVRTLYGRLSGTDNMEMLTQFEEVVLTMIRATRLQNDENERLEKSYQREKLNHEKHLRQLEEEMEGQVQKVEQRVVEQQQERFEQEKSDLKKQLEAEVLQLQESLQKLQKAQLTAQEKSDTEEMKVQFEELCHSNRSLQSNLTDAQTNLAVMRSELAQLRQSYAEKCRDLEIERETVKEYVQEQENLTRQLHLLHDANKRLHDTNDDLVESTEFARLSPRRSPSREVAFISHPAVIYYAPLSSVLRDTATSRSEYVADYVKSAAMHKRYSGGSHGSADVSFDEWNAQSLADELKQSERPKRWSISPVQHSVEVEESDMHEDVDSGHSTLPGGNNETSFTHHGSNHGPGRTSTPQNSVDCSSFLGTPAFHRYENHGDISFDDSCDVMDTIPDHVVNEEEGMELTDELEDDIENLRPNLSRHGSTCSHSSRGSVHSRASSRASRNSLRRHLHKLPQRMNSTPERMYKVVLCGDAAVGKSSFILRLCKNKFVRNLHSTLGVDFQTKTLEVDGRLVALQLWDTAGQERFRSIAKSYFRRADGVLLLYDCSYERSFTNVREWMNSIEVGAEKSIPVMLVGNKTDLRANPEPNKHYVSHDEGQRLARDYDALFIETSAKDGANVTEAAIEFARLLKSNEDLEVRTVGMKLHDLNVSAEKNKILPKNCC